ncbi:MAG: hypothetical protein KC776_03140 [Myxococcales bacterium]|nr:hypothetical protein [Myxococcales bacterium]MCB9581668.1 hypothetical protein [Polyangiaceae bacterium]
MRDSLFAIPFLAALVVALAHCGSSDDSAGASSGTGGFSGGGGNGGVATGGNGGAPTLDAGVDAKPPPEKELESSFRAPVATGRYVWSANPTSGRVALIDAFTLDLSIVEAGFGPTYLAAIADPANAEANVAIVLNVLSHDATLFRVGNDATISQKTLATHQGANAWAVSPKGHWAIAWTDASQVKNPDPTDGFQDVTVVRVDPGQESSTILSVGYRPTKITFDANETRAFAVTEPGISVVALPSSGEPSVDSLIEVTDDPLENPASRDVTITPDGSYALVRRDGSADVSFVDLGTGTRTPITLSGEVTDLDLSEDGTRAVAVVRESSEVFVLPVPGVLAAPADMDQVQVDGELFGSVALSADTSVALLYTNAVPNDHMTILSLAAGAGYLGHRTVALKAPVQAVFPAPDAQHAIALGSTTAGSSKAGAFSVVPTAALLSPKIVGTDAPPTAVALRPAPNSDRALITIRDDGKKVYGVYVVRLPNLQVDLLPLASPPLATGIVPLAGKGYVAQQHPEGRITFVDLEDGSAKTLTGFELGAKVVD